MKICRGNFFGAQLVLFLVLGVRAGGDDLPLADISSQLVREWVADDRVERVREVAALRGVPTPLHPDCEGEMRLIRRDIEKSVGVEIADEVCRLPDAFEVTMRTLDLAAAEQYADTELRNLFLYTALCHDLGVVDGSDGSVRAEQLLERLGVREQLCCRVCEMVCYWQKPEDIAQDEQGRFQILAFNASGSLSRVRRELREETFVICRAFAERLQHGVTVSQLLRFARLRFNGHRPPIMSYSGRSRAETLDFFEVRAREAGVLDGEE